jgi:hypothetical protein
MMEAVDLQSAEPQITVILHHLINSPHFESEHHRSQLRCMVRYLYLLICNGRRDFSENIEPFTLETRRTSGVGGDRARPYLSSTSLGLPTPSLRAKVLGQPAGMSAELFQLPSALLGQTRRHHESFYGKRRYGKPYKVLRIIGHLRVRPLPKLPTPNADSTLHCVRL